jgi:hypothetical protein
MTMTARLVVLVVVAAAQASAQQPAAMTGDEVLERYVAAVGGRAAHERIRNYVLEAEFEVARRGIRGTLEIRGKAPDKLLVVRTIEKVGAIRQGVDGAAAWVEDPYNGVRVLDGEELATARRSAVFNADLKWRELYERVELLGVEKLGDRDVYAVRLSGKEAPAETRYYDAATFLLVRSTVTYEGEHGKVPIETRYDDYREVDGVKMAFLWVQSTPAGETIVRVTRVRNNAEVPGADFALPPKADS